MQIVIVGDGKVGLMLTEILSSEGHNITVIDSNPRTLARTQEAFDAMAIQGHGASRAVLEEAGAATADLLIAATNSDEVNLLSCLTAKNMGCNQTIARVRSPEYASDIHYLKQDLGLSFVINPDEACAREIFSLLQFPTFLERERVANGRVEIVQVGVAQDSPLKGISLSQLGKRIKVRVLVCAIKRNDEILIPHGNFIIQEDDDLFITANGENLTTLVKNLDLHPHKIKHVTIIGGSRTGYYLAKRLLNSGLCVKIIERNPKRALELANLLPKADIVEADGTDNEILQAEGVFRADAIVSLMEIDEANIVLSIQAHQAGVPKIITKCNRLQYANMFRKMGVDTVVSAKTTSALEIVSHIRGLKQSSSSTMLTMQHIAGGMAEVLEFIAGSKSTLVGKPLCELPLRKGVLVVCVMRNSLAIIPTGETVIEVGDSVSVVTSTHRISDLEEIIKHTL